MSILKKVFVILFLVGIVLIFGLWWRNEQRMKQTQINKEKATIRLTFIEGWDSRDYEKYLKDLGLWKENTVDLHQKEGYLFPDTYIFNKNYPLETLVKMMTDNFEIKIDDKLKADVVRQGKSLASVITVASLVEAEANTKEDRPLVADIIWRRLAAGMPLQLDSTVNYITGGKNPSISLQEQTIDSPYNTYKFKGLPPGPINNPGLEAIKAAIYPEKNSYWYFLTGTDGKMYYAKNLEGHNLNKIKYL